MSSSRIFKALDTSPKSLSCMLGDNDIVIKGNLTLRKALSDEKAAEILSNLHKTSQPTESTIRHNRPSPQKRR